MLVINWQGRQIEVLGQAQLDNYNDTVAYYGRGRDKDGVMYRIRWDLLPHYHGVAPDDGTYACDWNNPTQVTPR